MGLSRLGGARRPFLRNEAKLREGVGGWGSESEGIGAGRWPEGGSRSTRKFAERSQGFWRGGCK